MKFYYFCSFLFIISYFRVQVVSTLENSSIQPSSLQFIDEEFFLESPCESNGENSLSSNFDEAILSTIENNKSVWDKDNYIISKSSEYINPQLSNQVIFNF